MSGQLKNRATNDSGRDIPAPDLSNKAAAPLISTSYLREPVKPGRASLLGRADTVLMVIAEEHKRRELANALANQGCKSLLADDGEAGLEIAKARQPGMIVVDVSLPGWDGFRTCAELRADELLRHIPVIMLSHGFGAEEKMRALRLGAVDYIAEPFDWAEVAAQISSQLKLERIRGELRAANFDLMTMQAQHRADLKAAAEIQKSLLPPRTTDKFEDVSVSWKFLPLDQVGGDLLGYAWLDHDHLATYVIDVCGHGLPAAMMTAAISISLTPPAETGAERTPAAQPATFSPKQMLEALDREYPIERFERPFTVSYLVFNRKTGEFRCSRAGHPMPIIVRNGGQLEPIEAGGTIIGLGHLLPFDEAAGKLNRGDAIVLYSDGVTECANESGIFGLEGLCQVLQRCSGVPPQMVCERIMTELQRFNGGAPMRDDVTILALTYESGTQPIEGKINFARPASRTRLSSDEN